jgi:hypothetical protein
VDFATKFEKALRKLSFGRGALATRPQENEHSFCTDGVRSASVIAMHRTVFRYQQSCQRRVSDYASRFSRDIAGLPDRKLTSMPIRGIAAASYKASGQTRLNGF